MTLIDFSMFIKTRIHPHFDAKASTSKSNYNNFLMNPSSPTNIILVNPLTLDSK